jgi:hypothetical protein
MRMNNWWKSGVVAIVWACLLGSVLAPSIVGSPEALSTQQSSVPKP